MTINRHILVQLKKLFVDLTKYNLYSNSNNNNTKDGAGGDDFIDWEAIKGDFDKAQQEKWAEKPPMKKDFYQEHPGKIFILYYLSSSWFYSQVILRNVPPITCNTHSQIWNIAYKMENQNKKELGDKCQ